MPKLGRFPLLQIEGQKGFTLIEVLIACFIFTLIAVAVYTVVDMSHSLVNTNNTVAKINQNAMQSLRSIGRELGESSPLADPNHLNIATDANGNSILDFQIPVDWDGDGDVYSGTQSPVTEWGAYHRPNDIASATFNGWVRYSVTNNQLIREVLDSSLSSVAGTSKVVANDVASFTAAQNSKVVTTDLGLSVTDTMGRQGQSQIKTLTFSSETFLRNAVS